MVKNPSANAGDTGSSPGLTRKREKEREKKRERECGKIPHAAEQLSPDTTTTEPAL